MQPQQRRRTGRRDRTVQYSPDHTALPGPVAIEAQPPRREDFFHAHGDGTTRDDADVAADRDRVDGPRLAGQVERARWADGKRFDAYRFARLRRLIERDMPVDANAAETNIDA